MTQDTRKDRRVKIVSLNVRYKSATVDEFIENHAYDVSRGGIFIKTANPFPPGTLLKFEIRLASDQAVIAGVGRIVWKRDASASNGDRPAGMGVKFIKIDDPSKVVIDKLVNTRADAGRAYESQEPAIRSSHPPRVHTPAPGRSPLPPPPRAARSMSPAPGVATPSTTPGPKSISTPAGTPVARKATMIGLGISSAPQPSSSPPGSASSPPGSPSSLPPRRGPFASAPSLPPRPGTGTGGSMFPKLDRDADAAPKQEQTVMKQAAELLEEALREAGGSMEEVGNNPLFSATNETPGTEKLATPITPASEWTTADTPQALAATVAARRAAEEAAAQELSAKRPTDSTRTARETPTSVRAAPADGEGPQKTTSKKTMLAIVGVAAAAMIVGGVMFRDRLFGGDAAAPDSVAAPPIKPEAVPSASAMATDEAIKTAPPHAVPSAAMTEAPPLAAAAPSATTSSASPIPSASVALEASVAVGAAPRPQKPAPRPSTPSAPQNNVGAEPAANVSAPPPATEAPAAPAPTPKAAPAPAPKPKPAKPPTDDNPY